MLTSARASPYWRLARAAVHRKALRRLLPSGASPARRTGPSLYRLGTPWPCAAFALSGGFADRLHHGLRPSPKLPG